MQGMWVWYLVRELRSQGFRATPKPVHHNKSPCTGTESSPATVKTQCSQNKQTNNNKNMYTIKLGERVKQVPWLPGTRHNAETGAYWKWKWPYGLWSTRLLCPRNSPGKNIGVGCCALLQGISWNQVLNPGLLHCRQISFQTLLSLGKAKVTMFLLRALLVWSVCFVSLNSYTLIYNPFRVIICI